MAKRIITDEQYRQAAKDDYEDEGTIEIDDNAKVSRGEDAGAYVQAWVWVYDGHVPPKRARRAKK